MAASTCHLGKGEEKERSETFTPWVEGYMETPDILHGVTIFIVIGCSTPPYILAALAFLETPSRRHI
jgi:hypothetical protein